MPYFDSTYLFRIYSVEPGHKAVKKLLAQTNQPVAIARHGITEVYSNGRLFLAAAPLFGLRGVDEIPLP